MRKLRLSVEELQVESFAPGATGEAKRGTVEGHAKATYGCTEGWDGCHHISVDGYSCYFYCPDPNEPDTVNHADCQ